MYMITFKLWNAKWNVTQMEIRLIVALNTDRNV